MIGWNDTANVRAGWGREDPQRHGHSRPVRDRAIVFLLLSTGLRRLGHRSQRYIARYTNPPEHVAASYVEHMEAARKRGIRALLSVLGVHVTRIPRAA